MGYLPGEWGSPGKEGGTILGRGTERSGPSHAQAAGLTRGLGWVAEKAMAAHSSVLGWRIPGTGEPGGVTQSWIRLK